MRRIITVGETTYDIIFRDGSPQSARVGGSLLNTSISLARLEQNVHFITRFGNDNIGDLSLKFLKENNVQIEHSKRFNGASRLALAFIEEHRTEPEYSIYKADNAPDLNFPTPEPDDIIIFGSSNAIRNEGRNELLLFLNHAIDQGAMTIYDPNLRITNNQQLSDARAKIEENFYLSKIVKGSIEDFRKIYGTTDASKIFSLIEPMGVRALFITSSENPIQVRTKNINIKVDVDAVKVVSPVGAGDNFTAGLVYGFSKFGVNCSNFDQTSEETIRKITTFGKACARSVCQTLDNYIPIEKAQEIIKG